MKPNDRILMFALVGALSTIVLVAYAPPIPPSYGVVDKFWAFTSTNFFTACAGAFAGALGAQWISERNTRRKNFLLDVKNYNAAIGMCYDVVNAYFVFKKNSVKPVCDAYFRDRARVASVSRSGGGPGQAPLRIRVENRPIDRPFSPIAALERCLQDRVIPEGAALPFLTLLMQGISTLNSVLSSREEFLKNMRSIPSDDHAALCEAYFAIGQSDEMKEGTFPEHMKLLAEATDDCIGIAMVLSRILRHYGKEIAKKLGPDAPKIAKVEWEIGDPDLPDLTRYLGWTEKTFGKGLDLSQDN